MRPSYVQIDVCGVVGVLDELGGGRLGLVDCLAACRAVPARLERRPTCGVCQGLAVGTAAAAPVGEQTECAGKLAAGLRQLVLEAARPLAVGRREEQRLPFEVTQPLCEGVRRDTADVLEQLVETARTAEERVDEEKRPPVADTLERLCERGFVHLTIVLRETTRRM